jgi:hypothetical protein
MECVGTSDPQWTLGLVVRRWVFPGSVTADLYVYVLLHVLRICPCIYLDFCPIMSMSIHQWVPQGHLVYFTTSALIILGIWLDSQSSSRHHDLNNLPQPSFTPVLSSDREWSSAGLMAPCGHCQI